MICDTIQKDFYKRSIPCKRSLRFLAQELNCKQEYIENVIALLDEGNTIPFIARYRKEAARRDGRHGAPRRSRHGCNICAISPSGARRSNPPSTAQEKLTDELAKAIDEAATLAEVEDLYRPYKPKRRTRATVVAKKRGSNRWPSAIFAQTLKHGPAPEMLAQDVYRPGKGRRDRLKTRLTGAIGHSSPSSISDDAEIRKSLRAAA